MLVCGGSLSNVVVVLWCCMVVHCGIWWGFCCAFIVSYLKLLWLFCGSFLVVHQTGFHGVCSSIKLWIFVVVSWWYMVVYCETSWWFHDGMWWFVVESLQNIVVICCGFSGGLGRLGNISITSTLWYNKWLYSYALSWVWKFIMLWIMM